MNCFLTGSSGFLGKHILFHLMENGFQTKSPRRTELLNELEKTKAVDLFIHAAGKAHSIKKTEKEVNEFLEINCELTKKVTEQIDKSNIQLNTFVFISTVAVYGIDEGENIDEETSLNGNTPYATSKRMAEEHLQKWANESGVNLVILRLPLIFGENAPGNLGAMERAVKGRYYFQIGKGEAKRSMVHAQQLAEFLPTLIGKSGIFNLTDGEHNSYYNVAMHFAKKHNRRIINVPLGPIKLIAQVGNLIPKFPLTSYRLAKLSQSLTFCDQKARKELGWNGSNALEF